MRGFSWVLLLLGMVGPLWGAGLKVGDYEEREVRGWTIFVEKELRKEVYFEKGMKLLDEKLGVVERVVPGAMLGKLREVPVWVSKEVKGAACYHPSEVWLRKNGRMVEKCRAVELQTFKKFVDWSADQPMMMLHEFAHAYHHRELGFRSAVITKAFEAARESGRYERVKRSNGRVARHYGLTNDKEYFAECTEAYFGRNDFYPFTRAELKEFDPKGFAMVEAIWFGGRD